MKVLHISSSDLLDSASRWARELHRALLEAGVESRLLEKGTDPLAAPAAVATSLCEVGEGVNLLSPREPLGFPPSPTAHSAVATTAATEEARLLQNFCFDENEADSTASAFHLGYPGAGCSAELGDCDLIHLHQVAGAISPADLRGLAALGKPIFWTLPDAWAFTGGCFDPGSCGKFASDCSRCPQLRDDSFELPSKLLADKIALFAGIKNLTVIAPSAFLANQARESRLFGATRIEQVPLLGGDPGAASPAAASGPLRIVFVCDSPGSQARSARLLRDLLAATQTYGAFRKLVLEGKVVLAFAGFAPEHRGGDWGIDLPFSFAEGVPAKSADLLVLAKPDENRPAALLEARAHGVPVLGFDLAGIGEVIKHRGNGWLVKTPELRPLAEALCFLAANPDMVRGMARRHEADAGALGKIMGLYEEALREPGDLMGGVDRRDALERVDGEFRKIVVAIGRLALGRRNTEEKLARLDSAERRAAGAEELLGEAQASLAKLERRQKQLIDFGQLSPAASKELGKIQKSAASLRNKLKWRARRLKIYNAPESALARPSRGVKLPAPAIPAWADLFHRLFLRNHWMKHGKKDQYPPRPLRGETFPKPRLGDGELPRIAIVTPSFMQGNYIEATIRSIVDQGYPNLAYAVHDGGSTDSTLEVISRYASRLTLWASQPDSGQARAIVSGFEKINGQVMAWVNSDDMLVPGALRYVGEYFATHPEVDAVYGHRIIVNERGQEIARWVLPPHQPAITPYIDPVPQETLFWRQSLWEKVGGLDPSFRFALDWDLVLRFQKAGANIVRLPYFLGIFRVHSQQKLSARAESIGAEEIGALRQRETGGPVTLEELQPYKQWMESSAAVYSRLLELGIRR